MLNWTICGSCQICGSKVEIESKSRHLCNRPPDKQALERCGVA